MKTFNPLRTAKRAMRLVLLFVVLFNGAQAFALRIYIAPDGKDSHPGTKQQPLASLEAALQQARTLRATKTLNEPIELIIQSGHYGLLKPILLGPEDSGTKQSPLLITGDKDVIPVFSGGGELPAFEKVNERLWKIVIPELARYGGSIQQLFVNGKRATRARTPNDHFFKTQKVGETSIDTSEMAQVKVSTKKISLTAEQLQALEAINGKELQEVIISVHHAWDRTRKYIQAKSVQDSALYIIGRKMHFWNTLDNSSQFIFENSREFLDQPGEWYLQATGELYYIPLEGERIETAIATTPLIDNFMLIQGNENQKVTHVTIENLSFLYTRYTMPMGGDENAQAAAPTDASIQIDYASHIKLNNLTVAHTSNNGIWFRNACSESEVTKSYVHDLGIGGIKIGTLSIPKDSTLLTNRIRVENNIIRAGGREFPTGVGVIIFQASDNTVTHNDISDFYYSGISVGWVWGYGYSPSKRNEISYNHIHHLGWGLLSDMGGVYTLGPSEGTRVNNNVIHDVYSYGYGGWGLYTDEGSTGITMENNLVYKCKSGGFHQHYGKDNLVRNNIFALQLKAQLEASRIEEHKGFTFSTNIVYFDGGSLLGIRWDQANFVSTNNLYWNPNTPDISFGKQDFAHWQATGKDKNSIIADPGFVDPLNFNFNFKNKSILSKISFIPFDYTQAGVYGKESWKELALFDKQKAMEFETIRSRMFVRELADETSK